MVVSVGEPSLEPKTLEPSLEGPRDEPKIGKPSLVETLIHVNSNIRHVSIEFPFFLPLDAPLLGSYNPYISADGPRRNPKPDM